MRKDLIKKLSGELDLLHMRYGIALNTLQRRVTDLRNMAGRSIYLTGHGVLGDGQVIDQLAAKIEQTRSILAEVRRSKE